MFKLIRTTEFHDAELDLRWENRQICEITKFGQVLYTWNPTQEFQQYFLYELRLEHSWQELRRSWQVLGKFLARSLKLVRLLPDCSNFSSGCHPILYLLSQSIYRCEHSALFQLCQYVFLHVKTTIATSKSFSFVASNIWNSMPNHLSSIPTLPAFRRTLKHHLFLLAYPDSGAKSGKIKPAQCITLRDILPTTAIAQPRNTTPPI